jgi:polysaccharide biosynthesis protein PslF
LRVASPSPSSSAFGTTIGILSTFPPTACGLATFSAALAAGLAGRGADVRVVRVGDGTPTSDRRVVGEIVEGCATSLADGAAQLGRCDVVVVQHEYGLYGGADGDEVLDVLGALEARGVPTIVVAHTILAAPTLHQRAVLEDVAALAGRVVVMSEAARLRLCSTFDVDPSKVVTIPHGAATPKARPPTGWAGRPTLLTWGLIGPGKGIERVIDAMQTLQELRPRPRYLVAGRTHPKVLAADGEAYRNARVEQAWRLGVAASVTFDAGYRDVRSLTDLVLAATVVVLPYDSDDQVTSGVLVDAIAAGRPVVATAFPHAVELLASGAGIVVAHDDPDALTRALVQVLTVPGLAAGMAAEAARLAPGLGWPVVAGAFLDLAHQLLAEPVRAERAAVV